MEDPIASLAVTMQVKKGTFALMLGSGVSKSAQIPTGWDIILNLIERMATVEGDTISGSADIWYSAKYGEEPSYGEVLDALAKTAGERSQLIRPFIEPSEEEAESGLKQPTDAHRAIASLVAGGYVKVIVTTNFDKLMEMSLTDVGVTPTVISSVDGILAAFPLVHNKCTVVKIHGDYIDSRILNTTDELKEYSVEFNRLLDQIFHEYGIIVSGWSAEWDTALRNALVESTSPWFSTYWNSHHEPGPAAKEIISARKGQVISNMDANEFFQKLNEGVTSVDELRSPELLSAPIAVASLKRYIDDPTKRIRIHDLVVGEAGRVHDMIENPTGLGYMEPVEKESIEARLRLYEESTMTLRALLATGCYWGKQEHTIDWISALDRLGSFPLVSQYYKDWLPLRFYPALLVFYAGGVSAIASGNYSVLADMLYSTTSYDTGTMTRGPLIFSANLYLFEHSLAQMRYQPQIKQGYSLPYRIRESSGLWETLAPYVPSRDLLDMHFDMFEYLFGLALVDQRLEVFGNAWAPKGLISFGNRRMQLEGFLGSIDANIGRDGAEWPPLKAGMFGASMDRLQRARKNYDERLRSND